MKLTCLLTRHFSRQQIRMCDSNECYITPGLSRFNSKTTIMKCQLSLTVKVLDLRENMALEAECGVIGVGLSS